MSDICACKRENNKKRNYVLVNPYQGKHFPIDVDNIYNEVSLLYNSLVAKFPESLNLYNNKIIIGFAETATGIGAIFSTYFENNSNSWYVTTTRENVSNEKYIDFSEEHSHATEQRLYYEGMKQAYDRPFELFFVEDEVTTGNTIKNTVIELYNNKLMKHCKCIYVNSLLNGMSSENFEIFNNFEKEIHIPIKFIYNETLQSKKEYTDKANNLNVVSKEVANYDMGDVARMNSIGTAYFFDTKLNCEIRTGKKVRTYHDRVKEELFKVLNNIENKSLLREGMKVSLIGTEECMFPAIELGKIIKERIDGVSIKTHSTTRSPIIAGHDTDNKRYILESRFKMHSPYESSRTTYLYNSLEYDKDSDLVIIITDSKISEDQSMALADLTAFYKNYCKAKEIFIVRL